MRTCLECAGAQRIIYFYHVELKSIEPNTVQRPILYARSLHATRELRELGGHVEAQEWRN